MGQESGDNKRLDSPLPSPGHKAQSNSCNSQGQVNTTPLSKQGLLAGSSSSQRPMCKGHLYLIQKPHGSRKQDQKGQPGNLERALMQVSQQACPRSSCSRPATASAIFFFFNHPAQFTQKCNDMREEARRNASILWEEASTRVKSG